MLEHLGATQLAATELIPQVCVCVSVSVGPRLLQVCASASMT